MTCKLCLERGKTWHGDAPRCAFESDTFDGENWNCATMSRLRAIAVQIGTTMRDDNSCACIGYVPLDSDTASTNMRSGYIVMTWYKNRGRTGQALIMWDEETPRSLTEREALQAISDYERRKAKGDGTPWRVGTT